MKISVPKRHVTPKTIIPLIAALGLVLGFARPSAGPETSSGTAKAAGPQSKPLKKVEKSEEQWRSELSAHEFNILRRAGTERPFTGKLLKNKSPGTYHCRGCGLALFSSDHKFKSGTGWPSFYDKAHRHHVVTKADNKYGMVRTEILCGRCGGHLGHVFTDGPEPTGLRYCVNSASLEFAPASGKPSKE